MRYRKERAERDARHAEVVARIESQPYARSLCGSLHHRFISKDVPGKARRGSGILKSVRIVGALSSFLTTKLGATTP